MESSDLDLNGRSNSAAQLQRLASALGCSTQAFFDPATDELGRRLELLDLWLQMDNEQDRQTAITVLQNVNTALQREQPTQASSFVEALAPDHTMRGGQRD